MSAKRVTLFRSLHHSLGRLDGKVVLADDLQSLVDKASEKFADTVLHLETIHGGVIDDFMLIQNDDVLIVELEADSSKPNTARSVDFPLQKCVFLDQQSHASYRSNWIRLNVGGRIFATSRETLVSDPNSMLARMFGSGSGDDGWHSTTDSTGAYLIDRSPEYFELLLDFLRHGKLLFNHGVNAKGVLEEAKFYGLTKAVEALEGIIKNEEYTSSSKITRAEFLKLIACTSSSTNLRCQGIDLEGVNLENLDLKNINFKYANLSYCVLTSCDLSHCNLEKTQLKEAVLDLFSTQPVTRGATLQCAYMPRANLEGASLKNCNFDAAYGSKVILEGANLKGACLDSSQMNGVNLRLASLKGASMKLCGLRFADMAGTDLENCDLTNSDLRDANLRGANLTGANFSDIVAPLHMSQTVN